MQRISNGPGFRLPDLLPFVRWQVFGFPLDFVEPADVLQGLGSQFTLVGFVQVVELAPGVSHATDLGDAVAEPGLVASVVVTHQLALPVTQEGAGVFACTAGSEVINGGFEVRERCGAVSPDVSLMSLFLTRGQHADRCFIGMQNVVFQQVFLSASARGCNCTPQAPTHSARVERGISRPARPKMRSWRYSGRWSAYLATST